MRNVTLVVALILAVVAAAFFAGKLHERGNPGRLTTDIPTTAEDTQPPVSVAPSILPATTLPAQPTAAPSLAANPDGKTYESKNLRVRFFYADAPTDKTLSPAGVLEEGNKIYVYLTQSGKPKDGQSIEVFDKPATQTLDAAIRAKFLAGISEKDCFAKTKNTVSVLTGKTVQQATIGYPVPSGTDLPYFTFGEKCGTYAETNGIQYFLYDPAVPDRYAFLRIGQGIGAAAYNSKLVPQWFDTVVMVGKQ